MPGPVVYLKITEDNLGIIAHKLNIDTNRVKKMYNEGYDLLIRTNPEFKKIFSYAFMSIPTYPVRIIQDKYFISRMFLIRE